MVNCKVHNVRFYKPKPKAIYCMALQYDEKLLAISRSDGSIEIWNIGNLPFIERTISSTTDNYSIEGLSWYGKRLFSVGLHGLLIEYDINKLCIINKLMVTGDAAFCLDIKNSSKQIAIGTELGYLNIFDINDDEVLFNKFLDKQEGRIICLKYDTTGDFIVSGGIDAIRIWNVQSGHAIFKMTVSRLESNKFTIIWSLVVTSDFTIISGDSRGKLTIWDGKTGTYVDSFQSHRADILTVCLSKDEKELFCAGVDPIIIQYKNINVKEDKMKWVKSVQRKIHDHDVRCLILCDNKLYSCGVDAYLSCSFYPPKSLSKHPPILQNSCVSIAKNSNLILLKFPKYLEIWSFNETNGDHECKKLTVLQRIIKSDDGSYKKEGIICSALSLDGRWIAYCTRLGIRIFQFQICEDGNPKLFICKIVEDNKNIYVNMLFLPNNQLVVASNIGIICIYKLDEHEAKIIQKIDTTNNITDTITFLITSDCGKYLVAGDPKSNISVWKLNKNQYKFHIIIPKYKKPPTALGIHPELYTLVITYSNNNIAEFLLEDGLLTEFSRSIYDKLPKQWLNRSYPIRNITFTSDKNIIVLHDFNNIIVINKTKGSSIIKRKIPKIDSSSSQDKNILSESFTDMFHYIKKYKHLVYLSCLYKDEMLVVEVNPLNFINQLPKCFQQNKYGKK